MTDQPQLDFVYLIASAVASRRFTPTEGGPRLGDGVELRDQYGTRWVVPRSMLVRKLYEPKPFGVVVRAAGTVWTKVDRGRRSDGRVWCQAGSVEWHSWDDGPGMATDGEIIWTPPTPQVEEETVGVIVSKDSGKESTR